MISWRMVGDAEGVDVIPEKEKKKFVIGGRGSMARICIPSWENESLRSSKNW